MATGIILAGGASRRMPVDKAFMEVMGRRVMDIQLEELDGLFEEMLIVGNRERMAALAVYSSREIRVVEEPVRGMGPLGGIVSGLMLTRSEENFVLACDMPFVRREAVGYILDCLEGYQVAVPATPKGMEPLHAAYRRDCLEAASGQLESGDLKVTDFYDLVSVRRVTWEELRGFDPTGRMLLNINSPEDMRKAAGLTGSGSFRGSAARGTGEEGSEGD
jgi:molybdopterin-guanine dinucleotide biosynthesis protein A